MIDGSVLEIRRIPRLQLPSASKMPARKPFRQSGLGAAGHSMSHWMAQTWSRAGVRIARMRCRVARGLEKANSVVAMPAWARYLLVRSRASESTSASRKLIYVVPSATCGCWYDRDIDVAVAADHPAQVASPVIGRLLGRLGEPAHAKQLAIHGQVRPARAALLRTGDVFPAAAGQEPVIFAGDQAWCRPRA